MMNHRNERSLITSPGVPVTNDGYDNEYYDLIVYKGDIIQDPTIGSIKILDKIGNGAFGQVFKAAWINPTNHSEIPVAIKISKSESTYLRTATQEAQILTYVCIITGKNNIILACFY